jgi:signal transduction histidine kinase/ActR/RegA family two-component response regulator
MPSTNPTVSKSLSVLVVDDLPENIELLDAILDDLGFTTVGAMDGVEALKVLSSRAIDIVIADGMMPKIDGFQLCKRVKSDKQWSKIPFIVYTAHYVGEEDVAFARTLGVDRYVMKSSRFEELISAINDVAAPLLRLHEQNSEIIGDMIGDQEFLEKHHAMIVKKLEEKMAELQQKASELRLKNEALVASENRYRGLFEYASVPIIIVEPDTNQILDINQRGLTLLKKERDKLSNLSEVSFDDSFYQIIKHAMRYGEGIGQTTLKLNEGDLLDIEVHATLFNDLSRSYLMIFAKDTTEQHRLRKQLLQAERMTLMGCLATGIAHEIRNPLTAVTLNLQLMEQNFGGGTEDKEILQTALEGAMRVQQVIENTLNLARVTPPKLIPEDLNHIITQALVFLRIQLQQNDIKLEKHFSPELPRISVDARQIQQVLLNVVQNAIEASPKGSTLEIRTLAEQRTSGQGMQSSSVVATIRDHGQGISAEQLQKLFEPLRTTKQGGTGIGLMLSKHIMEQHGGGIFVGSTPNEGTTVTLKFLPIVDTKEDVC